MASRTVNSHSEIGILLISDYVVLRSALRLMIENQAGMKVVGEANNKEEALSIASREQPEITVLDLSLAGDCVMGLIPALLETAGSTKIILLSGEEDPQVPQREAREGAMGIVKKQDSADILIKAIQRVHAGELWLSRSRTSSLVSELRRDLKAARQAAKSDPAAQLTVRERDIISLVGEGLRNKQIASRLHISEATVRNHLTSILKKLDVSDRLELLVFAYKNNIISFHPRPDGENQGIAIHIS